MTDDKTVAEARRRLEEAAETDARWAAAAEERFKMRQNPPTPDDESAVSSSLNWAFGFGVLLFVLALVIVTAVDGNGAANSANDRGNAGTEASVRPEATRKPFPTLPKAGSSGRIERVDDNTESALRLLLEIGGIEGAASLSNAEVRSLGRKACEAAAKSATGRDFAVTLATAWDGPASQLNVFLEFAGAATGAYCPDQADRLGI